MTTYPGEDPQTPDGEQPTDGTEQTQPVGYWERQAAEQARPQEQQGHPDPTTPYPQGSSSPVFNPSSGQASPGYESGDGQQLEPGTPTTNPYGQMPGVFPYQYPPAQGGAPAPYSAFAPASPAHPQSTLALVLGLVGLVGALFVCGLPLLVSPFAWAIGRSSLKDIRESHGRLGGESNARAGMIMGIIGTVLLILAVVAVVAIIVLVVMADSSYTSGGSSV